MSSHLHDPTMSGLLSSAWKELDAKFLSNDETSATHKLGHSITPADRLERILLHRSLYTRASDLILFLENVDVFELKQSFQLIVEAIFCPSHKYPPWNLRSITKTSNPREAAVVMKLLGATGSLVTLATKFLNDPGFIIQVGLDKLPFALSQRMYQGDIPAYFSSRLRMTDPYIHAAMTSPHFKCIMVNTFEFFVLSFASHICALQGAGDTSDYLVGWGTMTDTLYNNLLDDYLVYFFPCSGHGVPSEDFRLSSSHMNDSMYIAQNLRSHMMNTDTIGMNPEPISPRLTKASLLMDRDAFHRKSQSQKEVWRSETILLICTEMWMAHAPGVIAFKNSSPATTDKYGKVLLPTVDVVKSVRMLVRHCHFFLNCLTTSVMHPMEELKRDVYPTYQKRLYKFLRHLFYNWPLNNSFRIVYETWISYVQPWRYVHYKKSKGSQSTRDAPEAPVDSRWYGFIQENILYYTKLFNLILTRMSRLDFATTKNAMMFHRVAKVFTGPEYLKVMLADIDKHILSYEQPYYMNQINGVPARSPASPIYSSPFSRFSSGDSHKSSAILRIASLQQMMRDWEQADFIYEPLFSETNRKIICYLANLAKTAKVQLQEVIDVTLTQQKRDESWWDAWLGTNKNYMGVVGQSIGELQKAITQLEIGVSQFASFFDMPMLASPEVAKVPVFSPTRLPRTKFIGNSLEGSFLEGTENRVTVLPSGTFSCDMLIPIGNPDFSFPRSDECSLFVYLSNKLSGVLNDKYAGDIMRHYFQRNWKGRLARAAFAEPVEYFDIEKRGRSREKIRKVLPPRIYLRFLSSIHFLLIVMSLFVVCLMIGLKYSFILVVALCWLIFIFVRAVSEPVKKLDDLIYIFGDRNYNVDFRGQTS